MTYQLYEAEPRLPALPSGSPLPDVGRGHLHDILDGWRLGVLGALLTRKTRTLAERRIDSRCHRDVLHIRRVVATRPGERRYAVHTMTEQSAPTNPWAPGNPPTSLWEPVLRRQAWYLLEVRA